MKSILITLVLVSFVNSIQRNRIIACNYNVNSGPPSDIDANLCTHVLADGFLTMDSAPHHLVFKNYERNTKNLDRLKGLKSQNTDLKIVGAIDCMHWKMSCYFGNVVHTEEKIADFVKNAIKLMRELRLNGLHLGWKWPQNEKEKIGYSNLLKELRKGLSNKETLSSMVTWASISIRYNIDTMKSLDFVTVETFNFFGTWHTDARHHASFFEMKDAMGHWVNWGLSKNKILMGIPFFGVELELTDENRHEIRDPINKGVPEDYEMPYNKICQHIKNGWNWKYEYEGNKEPYAYKGKRWVSFEDPTSAAEKAKWVRDNGYKGVYLQDVNSDDIDAKCSPTDRPLMRAIVRALFVKSDEL